MASRRNAVAPMTVGQMEAKTDEVIAQMHAAGLKKIELVANPPMVTSDGALVETSKVEVKTVAGGEVERTTMEKLKPADGVVVTSMTGTGGAAVVMDGDGNALVTTVAPGVPGAQSGNWYVMTCFLYFAIAVFIIWLVGVWTDSGATYASYTNNYSWATPGVMGIFTTFAFFLLFVGTAWASYLTRSNMGCYQLTVVDYVLYIFELIFFVVAVIVLFRTSTTGTGGVKSTTGANAAFWMTLVGGVLTLVQTVIVCVTIFRCGCSWFPLIPLVLTLAWIIVALVVLYRMWKNN